MKAESPTTNSYINVRIRTHRNTRVSTIPAPIMDRANIYITGTGAASSGGAAGIRSRNAVLIIQQTLSRARLQIKHKRRLAISFHHHHHRCTFRMLYVYSVVICPYHRYIYRYIDSIEKLYMSHTLYTLYVYSGM